MSLRQDPSEPGLNYTFSKNIQESLKLAGNAARLDDGVLEPRYMLLGLLRLEEGVALTVLDGLGVDPDEIVERIEPSPEQGDVERPSDEPVGYTAEAKRVLEYALAEARELESLYVGSEHLLLALLRMEGAVARQVLNAAGVSHEDARAETLKVWASGIDEGDEGDNVAD